MKQAYRLKLFLLGFYALTIPILGVAGGVITSVHAHNAHQYEERACRPKDAKDANATVSTPNDQAKSDNRADASQYGDKASSQLQPIDPAAVLACNSNELARTNLIVQADVAYWMIFFGIFAGIGTVIALYTVIRGERLSSIREHKSLEVWPLGKDVRQLPGGQGQSSSRVVVRARGNLGCSVSIR